MANEKRLIEYISREEVCMLCDNKKEYCGKEKCPVYKVPTVDAEPVVHGRWINTPPYYAPNGNYNKAQECSVCHSLFVSSGTTPYSNHPYCCECGAKMDGGNEDGK